MGQGRSAFMTIHVRRVQRHYLSALCCTEASERHVHSRLGLSLRDRARNIEISLYVLTGWTVSEVLG